MKYAVLLLFIPVFLFSQVKKDPQHKVKIGDPAPDFSLRYMDGKTGRLSDLKGKVVMLQFTASWCSVCRKEMPFIERDIWQKHREREDFFLAGIDLKEDRDKISRFVKATGITYPVLLDPDGAIFGLYAEDGAGVTRNILIDREGRIVYLTRLFDPEEFEGLKRAIESELAK